MSSEIKQRLSELRKLMKDNGLSAFLVNGSDPHMSEYVPDRWKSRDFISGFTGSYGWLALTLDKAVLWTDSRYYLQANQQLEGTGIVMFKARDPEEMTLDQWIASELKSGDKVGFDGACYSTAEVKVLEKNFSAKGIQLEYESDILSQVWTDRPAIPAAKAFLHPVKWAGESRSEKFSRINQELEQLEADAMIISALDDLAWTFNIRGGDVEFNPVVLGYGIVGKENKQLFVDTEKLDEKSTAELLEDGVEILAYEQFFPTLAKLKNKTIFIDPARANCWILRALSEKNKIIEGLSIANFFKSIKNEAELEGMKQAHVTDGLALLSFQVWLEDALANGETVTEFDVAEKLVEYRSKRGGYVGPSFYPIIGYRDHGAIVHFRVTEEVANKLEPEGMLLFDSGGQYEYGTTDITRTIALGPVTAAMKRDFTLVLKGMINLTRIKFPKGTIGCHLDVLARHAMWMNAINYGHGTGHGVGAFMNVHEGPQSIRQDLNEQPIRLGHIFSNEPGMYRENQYGLRTENLIYCVEDVSNEFATFYRFETLTKYPIDTRLVDKSLLSDEEVKWINDYHQSVLTTLSHFTNSEEYKLLKRLTQAI